MNNTNIALYFSKFVGITGTIPTDHLVIVNIVGNISTIPSDALLLLQFICVSFGAKTPSHFTNKKHQYDGKKKLLPIENIIYCYVSIAISPLFFVVKP